MSKEKNTDKNIVFNFEKSNSKSNIINMNGNGIFDCKSHGSRSAVKINSSNSFVKIFDANLHENDIEKPIYKKPIIIIRQ